MVQGTSSKQKATENTAALRSALENRRTNCSRVSADISIVNPTAAANNPLSGRKKTARPATNPASVQNNHERRLCFDFIASVVSKHNKTARKPVGTSVKIVAT